MTSWSIVGEVSNFDQIGNEHVYEPINYYFFVASSNINPSDHLAERGDETRTASNSLSHRVDVRAFGAVGDGIHDDATAIDNAVNYVSSIGGGTVYIPTGTWLLGTVSKRKGSYASYIVPMDNVNIVGKGESSIIKVKSGENAKYPFNVIVSSIKYANCVFRDFVIDINGQNNLLHKSMSARNNIGIGAINGAYNITIRGVTIKNNPGNQCIAFYVQSAQHNIGKIDVSDCKFMEVGSGLPHNYNIDHSSVVLYGGNNKIYNNTFGPSTNHIQGAMFEIHGPNAEAYNNYGSGYDKGWYFAKQYYALSNTRVHDNRFDNISMAFDFSSLTSLGYGTAYIYNNLFHLKPGSKARLFFGFPDTVMDALIIKNNYFYGNNTSDGYRLAVIKNVRDFIFEGNYVDNMTAYGFLFSGDNNVDGYSLLNVYIKNNQWKNIGIYPLFNATGTGTTVKYIEIVGNYFERETAYNAPAVFLGMKAGRGIYTKNVVDNNYSWDFALGENTGKIHVDQELYTSGGMYPNEKGGSVGSIVYDTINNIIYRKMKSGNEWQKSID